MRTNFESGCNNDYLQLNTGGVRDPLTTDFPRLEDRVDQDPNPFKAFADYEVQRTTVQWDDNCNLACPGCYTKQHLVEGGTQREQNVRTITPPDTFLDQIVAHGDSLKQVYFLGVEPTFRPRDTAARMRATNNLGLSAVVATNGARAPKYFDQAFGEAIDNGSLERVNISLDSIDPSINNRLRGKDFAFARTMKTIRHAVEKGINFQVTMTVWADNYHTVIDTLENLHGEGVRGFVFHEGSLEGAPDYLEVGVRRVQPLEWRALTSELRDFRLKYDVEGDRLSHFVYPYIYYTDAELKRTFLGSQELYDQYIDHETALRGGAKQALPFNACPAVDVPQVYLFGNDGNGSNGAISLCNMHTIQTGKYIANYDPETKNYETVQDPDKNQMLDMISSPYLCPAQPNVTRDGNPTSGYRTLSGDLHHACRYVSSNQFPDADYNLGKDLYGSYKSMYESREKAIRGGASVGECDAIFEQFQDVSDRCLHLKKLLASKHRP